MVVEDGDLGVVRGNVAVELLLVVVPFHRVEVVPLQVVVALEHGLLALEGVRGDDGVLEEADAEAALRKKLKVADIFTKKLISPAQAEKKLGKNHEKFSGLIPIPRSLQ